MSNRVNTRKRALIIVVGVVLVCALLGIGTAVAGGAVYALTRGTDWLGRLSGRVSLPVPSLAEPQEERAALTVVAAEDDEQGIVIGAVLDDGPAAAAGVERGDILIELDGQAVNSHADLQEALAELEPGDEVELRVLHGDDERRLTATLDERDARAFLGLVPCCAIRESIVEGRVPERIAAAGALITDVVDDSPADEASLQQGDIVLAVDDQELGAELTLADAISAHQPGDAVTLTVRSPARDKEQEITVELGEHPDEEGVAYLGVTYLSASTARMGRFPPRDDWRPLPETEPFLYMIPHGLARVVVTEVVADSPADEAGVRRGDFILELEGDAVETPEDVVRAVTAQQPGDEMTMTILRPGEEDEEKLELSVTLGEHPEDEARAYLGVGLGFGGVRFRRFGGKGDPEGWHWEFDLPEDWHPRFHVPESWDLPFDLDELPHHFEFEFLPRDHLDEGEALPGSASA